LPREQSEGYSSVSIVSKQIFSKGYPKYFLWNKEARFRALLFLIHSQENLPEPAGHLPRPEQVRARLAIRNPRASLLVDEHHGEPRGNPRGHRRPLSGDGGSRAPASAVIRLDDKAFAPSGGGEIYGDGPQRR
jgi:hypothetical protein